MKLFRWKALVPAAVVLGAVVLLWALFADALLRRGIEYGGTEAVGARVELAAAHISLLHADLSLRGLQVTDPQAPMTNMVEIAEIVADLDMRALLSAKGVIDTMAVRGVRFGTPRRTSGAVPNPSPPNGAATRRILAWATGLRVPALDLRGLAGANLPAITVNADSLRTPAAARAAQATADSLQHAWEANLRGVDPQPLLDSARVLADQLGRSDLRRLNPIQAAAQANAVRAMIARIGDTRTRLDGATRDLDAGVTRLRAAAQAVDAARRADADYARGLLHLPSLHGPDISKSLFGSMIADRLKPALYWLDVADRYIPPGLDPRRHAGPARLRLAGTTFTFPRAHAWPTFLLRHADADVTVAGKSAATGAYRAAIDGVTTEPALYGRPLTFAASRAGATVGPHDARLGGLLDRTGAVPHDSVALFLPASALPDLPIAGAGATLSFGDSTDLELSLARRGGAIAGLYRMTSRAVHWTRPGADSTGAPGSTAWAEGLLWRSLRSIPGVTIEARIGGTVTSPTIDLTSNVGDAVEANLKQVLGEEARRAEAAAQAKVDSLVGAQAAAARQKLDALQSGVADRLGLQRQQLDQAKAALEAQLARLGSGIRLPGLPGLPRP